jgi:hypothetical protein
MPLHMLDSVKRIVVGSVPGDVSKEEYFTGILEQAFEILRDGEADVKVIVEGILMDLSRDERDIYINALGFGSESGLNADGEVRGLNEKFDGLNMHGTDLDGCDILKKSDKVSCSLALCDFLSPSLLVPILPILFLLVEFKKENTICNIVSLEDRVLAVSRAGINDASVVKVIVDGVLSRLVVSIHASGSSDGGVQLVVGERMIGIPETVIERLVLDEIIGPVLLLELFYIYGAGGEDSGKAASVVMMGLGDERVVVGISKDAGRMLALCRGVIGGGDEGMQSVALGITAITFTMEESDVLLEIGNEVIGVLDQVVAARDGDVLDRAVDARQAVLSYISRHAKTDDEEGETSQELLDESLRDLADAEIPNRAHGMSRIKDLVLVKDPVIINRLSSILDLYLQQLIHPDRFGRLNLIQI